MQDRIALISSAFWELGTVGKVTPSLRDRALTIPRRNRFGDVVWRVPASGPSECREAALASTPARWRRHARRSLRFESFVRGVL